MFNDTEHKAAFLSLCPGKLLNDAEWFAPVFVLTSDYELRRKAAKHINPDRREIRWQKIFDTDFGSGHRAALYWAFSLWAGNSWVYEDDSRVDTMDKIYFMDERLRRTAITALELRWRLKVLCQNPSFGHIVNGSE